MLLCGQWEHNAALTNALSFQMKELVGRVASWVNLLFMQLNIIMSEHAGQQALYRIPIWWQILVLSGNASEFQCCYPTEEVLRYVVPVERGWMMTGLRWSLSRSIEKEDHCFSACLLSSVLQVAPFSLRECLCSGFIFWGHFYRFRLSYVVLHQHRHSSGHFPR